MAAAAQIAGTEHSISDNMGQLSSLKATLARQTAAQTASYYSGTKTNKSSYAARLDGWLAGGRD